MPPTPDEAFECLLPDHREKKVEAIGEATQKSSIVTQTPGDSVSTKWDLCAIYA